MFWLASAEKIITPKHSGLKTKIIFLLWLIVSVDQDFGKGWDKQFQLICWSLMPFIVR